MKLYYSKGACSLAVRIILHELSLECDYESVNLGTKKTANGLDFYTINPKGVVPVLQLDNGEILTENGSIQQYLADNFKGEFLLPPVGDFKRYRVLEWLSFIGSDLHKGCGPLFKADIPDALKQQVFIPALKKHLAYVNQHLMDYTYLIGDQFTLPDAYLFVILSWMKHLKIDISEFSNLERYASFLKQRAAIIEALKEES